MLEDVTYLLPWEDNDDGTEKLYHWNLEGGTTTWDLADNWRSEGSITMYELSDQGRINAAAVQVTNGQVTLDAKAATAYVLVKEPGVKTLKAGYGEMDYVVDPGFNGYTSGSSLSAEEWSGDIAEESVVVEKAATGDQRLAFNSPATEVGVTTTISGLKPQAEYVAEVYVENNSDVAAKITVDAGDKVVSNHTFRSILNNYVKSDQKNGTKMQRMQVSFTAESEAAQLTLSREGGEGASYMDDIRIVEKALDNFKADGSFEQDFESVVQGLYPFVLSSAQGISDPATHLSQKNEPYTQRGWNNRVIDDVIEGEWSLKHHNRNTGIIYQTLPQNFRFEPGKVYEVEFDYQSGPNQAYAMVVGNGTTYTMPAAGERLPQAHTTQHVTMEVIGHGNGQTWIGLYENSSGMEEHKMGGVDFVLDNLVIREIESTEVFATLDKEKLFKGETASIYGNGLEQIVWESSNPAVATVDKAAGKVKALAAGTTTLTAVLPDGENLTFEIAVEDRIVKEIPDEELDGMTAFANTEEAAGEGPDSGRAIHAVDGNSSSLWHTQWNGSRFTVSESSPAVLTVDLGSEMAIGGFQFLQRASSNNGVVQKFSYRIMDGNRFDSVAAGPITLSAAEQVNGTWVTAMLEETVAARYIEISVVQGGGNYAAIAEVKPIRIQKLAETISLADHTLDVGQSQRLIPIYEENAILKGLVWSSADENIAAVDKYGVVTAKKEGKVTITASNAAGVAADCVVTVKGTAAVNFGALEKAIQEAEKIDLAKYQDGAEKNTFIAALKTAKEILESKGGQTAVNQAAQSLTRAQAALKPVSAAVDPGKPNDTIVPKPWPFEDIPINSGWKYDNAKYVYDRDIMNGISGTKLFDPDGRLNRAMFATVLYRMAGNPTVAYSDTFTDVSDNKYYTSAILWAAEKKIVSGFTDGSYGVLVNITREQIAKMLYEYAAKQGYDVSGEAVLDDFTDKDSVSHWAVGYMKWAVNTGMISGKPNGDGSFRLDPKGEATRAECAKMLTMFMKEYQPQ